MRPLTFAMFARLVGLVIGIVLIYSGTIKVSRPYDFMAAVFQYQMFGPALATFVAAVLPFLELTIGFALLCGVCPLGASVLTVLLFLTFAIGQALTLLRGIDADCGCFGNGEKIGWVSLTRTLVLLVAAVVSAIAAYAAASAQRPLSPGQNRYEPSTELAPSRRTATSPAHAFTLVELLVVIGIIAIIIGLLLPVLAGVQARGRDIKCQANLRSIVQAMYAYAAENGGSMPWGLTWQGPNSAPSGTHPSTSWAGLVARHMGSRSGAAIDDYLHIGVRPELPGALVCPEAAQGRSYVVSYAVNYLVCIIPKFELTPPLPGSLSRPARASQLHKDAALVWDTAIRAGSENRPQMWVGIDIDGQRIATMGQRTPQYRFLTVKDALGQTPPGTYGQNKPVVLNVLNFEPYRNVEPAPAPEGVLDAPYQGNLRFRHRKDTTCNVAFADGSVRQFTASMNADKTVKDHDALRRYFMLKWPTGVAPNPGVPH